jgi:hypothetical protein
MMTTSNKLRNRRNKDKPGIVIRKWEGWAPEDRAIRLAALRIFCPELIKPEDELLTDDG